MDKNNEVKDTAMLRVKCMGRGWISAMGRGTVITGKDCYKGQLYPT